jgi:signal transduction histidine kinase
MLESTAKFGMPAAPSPEQRPLPFEQLLFELSTHFVAVPGAEIDAAIEGGLRRIVEFLGIDHSTLSEIVAETRHFHAMHSWAAEGVRPVGNAETSRTYPWVLSMARAGRPVIFSKLDQLPPDAAEDRRSFERIGLRSHVALPLFVAGQLMAVLGFSAIRHERAWPMEFVQRLRLVAELFAGALARKCAQAAIDQAVGFERLASTILASLLLRERRAQDRAIDDAIRDIGVFLRLDRVTLWERRPPHAEFHKTHRWLAANAWAPSYGLGAIEIPWLSRQLIDGVTVCYSRQSELPPEAQTDHAALRALGIRSLLGVPLIVYGEVVGAFSLATMHEERIWPKELIRGVELLAKVFASLRARRTAELQAVRDRAALHHMTRVSTLGQLSASIAHQLNQPLAAILGNAEAAQKMLGHKDVDLVELRSICDDIVSENNRAAEVIRRLGALYKRGEMKLQPLDVNGLIRETTDLLRSELLTRQVTVAIDFAASPPMVDGGRVQLQQVLLNLVLNAADAMAETEVPQRRLTLCTTCHDAEVHVDVIDRGPGIAPDDLKNIFDAFWSTKPGGMGVGLAICQSIVAAHRGKITATNNTNGGATFRVTLPSSQAS